ncbi:DUF3592 domain-containing protein [Kosakonia sp. BK9b]|uniref:DUF3592 domain-containing protein n=1 Tax=Kosakonia sp. TaxID=1916651 RepID=UPI0028971E25|nr:DUF3592 domain-containing protein [Kosakonia sp.]
MDLLPTLAMWLCIILCSGGLVIVFIGVRNSVISSRENEAIKRTGIETVARITDARQPDGRTTEGGIFLQLTLEFTAGTRPIATQREIIVKVFDADKYRRGNTVVIRYRDADPTQLVIMGDVGN